MEIKGTDKQFVWDSLSLTMWISLEIIEKVKVEWKAKNTNR